MEAGGAGVYQYGGPYVLDQRWILDNIFKLEIQRWFFGSMFLNCFVCSLQEPLAV